MTQTIPLPHIPPMPAEIVAIIRKLARRTALGERDWVMPQGEAWALTRENSGGMERVYPTHPVSTLLDDGWIDLRLYPGARWCASISIDLYDSLGRRIGHHYVDSMYDYEDLFDDLLRTWNAALVQAQCRDAANGAEAILGMRDELQSDEVA